MIPRLFVIGAYLVMALLGVLSMFTPPPSYSQTSSGIGTIVWSSFLVVGGILCAIEVVHRYWILKAIGLSFLVSSTLSYAVFLLLRDSNVTLPYSGWLLLAFSLYLAGRLGEIVRALREQRRHDR